MELQINRLETRVEKMQEMFNKDLEEMIKSLFNNLMRRVLRTGFSIAYLKKLLEK